MCSEADAEFWLNSKRYKDLVKTFERNIQVHGARGFYECELGWGGHCPFCATNAKYYEYTGPQI